MAAERRSVENMSPHKVPPIELVGDWRHICTTHNNIIGYFTLQPDGRYIGFSDIGADEDLKKTYPHGWHSIGYYLHFASDSDVVFHLKEDDRGMPHTYHFEGGILILKRLEPYARWECTKVSSNDLPDSLKEEKQAVLNRKTPNHAIDPTRYARGS